MTLNDRIKRAFWKIRDDGFEIVHHREEKPFEHAILDFKDERVSKAVEYHNRKWFHNEIVVKAKNATVEPRLAYAVDGLRTIIGACIRTRENLPSPVPILKAKLLGKRKQLKKAILFDGSMGINYFHLMSDVLHKLYLLEEHTSLDCPILVGQEVWKKSFFQYLITETELSELNWQRIDKPTFAKELWISRPLPYDARYWNRTKALLVKEDSEEPRNVLFINRKGTRHITNFEDIQPVLERNNVKVVDPGSKSVSEQAKLFNSCSHVIGIHGAGLTNLAFCNYEKTKVLELVSNNRIGTQYYWLSTALGINWDMMLGGEANADQSFAIDSEQFEERLTKFLIS